MPTQLVREATGHNAVEINVAYKPIRAKQREQRYELERAAPLLSPCMCPAACLLPACLVPRLRFQNFLLQATFRAASALCVRVCVCVRESLCNFLLSLSAPLTPASLFSLITVFLAVLFASPPSALIHLPTFSAFVYSVGP